MKRLLFLFIAVTFIGSLVVLSGCEDIVYNQDEVTRFDTTLGQACLSCHSDANDTVIVVPKGQWANSAHASTELLEASVDINGSTFNTAACGPQCHSGDGYVDWVTSGSTSTQTQPSTINCFTCHLPHTGVYGTWRMDTLRGETASLNVRDTNGTTRAYSMGLSNMCARCHQASDIPILANDSFTINALFGPHSSTQANVMIGAGLYRFDTVTVANSHQQTSSRDGCLSCHFGTGVGYEFGEHTFRLENESGEQLVGNCNVSGCHVSGSGPSKIVTDLFAFSRLDTLAVLDSILESELKARGVLDSLDPKGLALKVNTVVPKDLGRILNNYLMYRLDGSSGIHNPRLFEQVLRESIAQLDSL